MTAPLRERRILTYAQAHQLRKKLPSEIHAREEYLAAKAAHEKYLAEEGTVNAELAGTFAETSFVYFGTEEGRQVAEAFISSHLLFHDEQTAAKITSYLSRAQAVGAGAPARERIVSRNVDVYA